MRCEFALSWLVLALVVSVLLPQANLAGCCASSATQLEPEESWLLAPTSLATHVVLGVVVDTHSEGTDLASVKTFVTLEPLEVLKAPDMVASGTITVRHVGGILPGTSIARRPSSSPWFSVGDTTVVFLTPIDGTPYFEVLNQRFGQFKVSEGRLTDCLLEGLTLDEAMSRFREAIRLRSPSQLAEQCDLVCYGTVVAQDVVSDSTGYSSTVTTVAVVDAIKGRIGGSEVLIRQPGDVRNRGRCPYDLPLLLTGEHYVLFLRREADGSYKIVGGYGGSYRVKDDSVWRHNWPLSRLRQMISGARTHFEE